jgi:hypothetical protein
MGMVVVPIVSYLLGGSRIGWASAPYNPQWAIQNSRRAAAMSLAGPGSNLLILIMAAMLIRAGIAFHFFEPPFSVGFSRVTDAISSGGYFFASALSILFSLTCCWARSICCRCHRWTAAGC